MDNRTSREIEEPVIEITIEEIHEQIAKEKEQQRKPTTLAYPGERQEQEVPQQDLGDQDLNPPAAAEGQIGFGEDEVYSKDVELVRLRGDTVK